MAETIRPPLRSLLLAATALLLQLPATAQQLEELRLRDGRVLVGKVTNKGHELQVRTSSGTVTVAGDDVVRRRDRGELQAALKERAKKSGDTPFAHVNLARQARDYGLEREMWRHLDKAITKLDKGDDNGAVTRMLRDFLAQLEPELLDGDAHQAPTGKRVLAMLREFRADTSPAEHAALQELLVREPNADADLRQQARRNPSARQRTAALAALQRRELAGNRRFVLRTAVLDRSKSVREAAVDIGRAAASAEDVTYMAAGLMHPYAKVRVRTADALGQLGHPAAIELIVKAGPHAASGLAVAADNGGATRGHVAFLKQQAYIRDFNVEVAQAAFIADPVVDVLQSGSVLDVTVAGVQEVRTIVHAYRGALKKLAGHRPGPDPRAWATWLDKLPKPATPVETGKPQTGKPQTGKPQTGKPQTGKPQTGNR